MMADAVKGKWNAAKGEPAASGRMVPHARSTVQHTDGQAPQPATAPVRLSVGFLAAADTTADAQKPTETASRV